MKANLFHPAIAVGVALLFAVHTTRADEPKNKRHARTEKHVERGSGIPAKSADNSGKIPTRDGRHSTSAEGRELGGANGQETRVPTGSLIPQTYNRRGYTTDSANNSYIIDQNDVRFRSENTPSEILRTIPGVTVRGGR